MEEYPADAKRDGFQLPMSSNSTPHGSLAGMAAPNLQLADRKHQHAKDRAIMVARHLEARGISDPLVLAAMGEVPREAFVSEPLAAFAYEDSALPICAGATIGLVPTLDM